MASHTPSQRYLSTRGGSHGLSFEEAVLKGLASDNGLFIPEEIPSLPPNWENDWLNFSFEDLAFHILSLYISPAEISPAALKDIIHRSYSTFRAPSITPTVTLDANRKIHLLELFQGPTYSFKDVALQFLGNLFEFFLVRRNEGKTGNAREHLTVIGATSGDTGSAAIYGLRAKKDVSVFIMYPTGKVSAVQEAQMTTVQDENVHCLSVDGTFDDCQDFVKALFADPQINKTQRLAAVNSINLARILAQQTYYFASYFSLIRSGSFNPSTDELRFVVPTGNFGDILAGYFAKRMGLPTAKLHIATNSNDILHRFWQTGAYEKHPVPDNSTTQQSSGIPADGSKAHPSGVRETLSPAMDILVSSNFERLLWFLAYEVYSSSSSSPSNLSIDERRQTASAKVLDYQTQLKTTGGFRVDPAMLDAARRDFTSDRVSDEETLATIREVYRWSASRDNNAAEKEGRRYILDPHSAIGLTASLRSISSSSSPQPPRTHYISLATAHPAKFSNAVHLALSSEPDFDFERDVQPDELRGLEELPRRVVHVRKEEGVEGVRGVILRGV
ncbi:MAG: hypothetical protein Q9227_001685 [Pyrenula ochraceoflavens]